MIKNNYTILAIETSLDDTCAAVTVDDRVISNVVASQVSFHEEFGGTVPHVAKRMHEQWLKPTIEVALRKAGLWKTGNDLKLSLKIDAIAVTYGPGLAPCLEVGLETAKVLAQLWKKPMIAVNHMEGHLLSSFAKNSHGFNMFSTFTPQYPALGFLISGGHTQLVLMNAVGKYTLLGETLDDAAGEAYDKVARMLGLGYPGGPILAELAKQGEPKYNLPEPMRERGDLNFSFSGLKTACKYKLAEFKQPHSRQFIADFAASFEKAVITMLMRRLERAIRQYKPKMILLGGGVVSNTAIRAAARKKARECGLRVVIPYSKKLFTDNAAMIGVSAWHQAQRGDFVEDLEKLDRQPNLNFSPAL